jgi:hypothetical protein
VENFTNAVFGRFFAEEPRTFARTLTFRGFVRAALIQPDWQGAQQDKPGDSSPSA